MEFTKVIKKSTGSERIMDGYKFVGIGESVGNLHSGDLDAFYDGWDGNIEQGEDGNLYLVQRLKFRAEDVTPVIWCKVEREDKKQFGAYTVSPCTAVALCDGEDKSHRQPAVYVTTVTDGGERVEHVVFGWNYADLETEADFGDMCADSTAWEPLTEEHHVKF